MKHSLFVVSPQRAISMWAGEPSTTFVTGMPSHYVRAFHCQVQALHEKTTSFVYVADAARSSSRRYEEGQLPYASIVVGGRAAFLRVWAGLEKFNPEIVVQSGHSPWAVLAATCWAWYRKSKLFYWSDSTIEGVRKRGWLGQTIRRSLMGMYLRRVDCLLYVGKRTREFYKWSVRRADGPRLHRLPYPALLPQCSGDSVDPRAGNFKIRLLYLGRLVDNKGVEDLIAAVALMTPETRSKLRVTIAGDGPCRAKLESVIMREDLDSLVSFVGFVRSRDVSSLMCTCDIVVLPSHREPWGVVVNEAMGAGKPVVVSDAVGAAADLLAESGAGYVVGRGDVGSLCRILMRLVSDGDSRRRMGTLGAARVRSGGWSLQGAIKDYEDLLAQYRPSAGRHR